METAPITEAQARVTHVRGVGMVSLRATLKVTLYGGRWEEFLARLSPEARALMEHTPALDQWIDTALLLEIHQTQREFPHLDTRKVRGELSAEEEVKAHQSEDAVPTRDPRPIILRLPDFWTETSRGGGLIVDSLTDGEGMISVWAIFPYIEFLRDVGPARIRHTLLLAGAQDPKVDYLGPGPDDPYYRHRYWLKWTPVG